MTFRGALLDAVISTVPQFRVTLPFWIQLLKTSRREKCGIRLAFGNLGNSAQVMPSCDASSSTVRLKNRRRGRLRQAGLA